MSEIKKAIKQKLKESVYVQPNADSASGIEERLKKVIADQLNIDPEDIKPESSFIEDLGADSLDTVQLIMSIEEEFGVEIPDEESTNIKTVGAALKYLEANIK